MKTPSIPESLAHLAADQAIERPPDTTPEVPRQRLWNVVSKAVAASSRTGGEHARPRLDVLATWLRQAWVPLRWGCPVPLGRMLASLEHLLGAPREATALHDAPDAPTRPASDLDRCRWLAQAARQTGDADAMALADALDACAARLAERQARRRGG